MRLSDMTSVKPSTLGELQLYKVLQRANLLSYYDAFISQGGDDVQQLCEAGEEEFLEIMALVSMACKPLHVRRLQKALQEWVTRPAIFRSANMHYLPAQSISLTSLGIDTRDLILPSQNSPRNSTSPGFQRDTSAPQSQDDDILSQPLSMNGSAVTTPKSSSGLLNVFRLDDRPRKLNGVSSSADSPEERERPDGDAVSAFLDTAIQKYMNSPMTLLDKKDVISQLQADRSHRELAVAIDNENRPRMEALIRDFVKLARDHEDGTASQHEVLIVDAAVKLCMSDVRWLLKKTELLATAEKIANEVKSKYASRRRSSTHLHGSCSQSRIQEVNKHLQNIKTQRTSLHKKLAEAQANKNVIKENECQNVLTCIARDEATLLQERKELTKKLQNEIKPQAVGMGSSFSSELAGYYNSDLAKAHNLNFGNLQPSTSNWAPVENGVSNARKTPENGSSPSHTTTVSPGHLSVGDVRSLQDSERTPPGLLQIKRESDGADDDAFPSKANGAVKSNKRKRSATGSPEGSNNKKLVGATDAEIE